MSGLENKCAVSIEVIEHFLRGRTYCTELYISPLGFQGGEAWQVELNYGADTETFQGNSIAAALANAMEAAMRRHNTKDEPRAQNL